MLELQQHTGKLKAENYGLMEWALDIQAAINQGYELDMSNEGYCQNFGSLYTCLLKKKAEVPSPIEVAEVYPTGVMLPDTKQVIGEVPSEQVQVQPTEQPTNKRGPKSRVN